MSASAPSQHSRSQALARAAEERGAAMSLATAAEYALLLTSPAQREVQAAPGPG